MENTYVVLMDSLDTIYNGYAVGVYDREKGTIKFNPKSIKFPFDPVSKKIVRETEDDFEDLEDGTFNLTNVPQDGKLADDFFRKRASILSAAIHTRDSKTCKEISLVQAGGHNIFVRVNLDDSTDTEHGSWKAGDIISLDMSKEIKDKLL